MLIWFFEAILNIFCMFLCYLTNPIVVLFSDEHGELPGFLKLWQTWDDSLNPRFFVLEKVPKLLRYDYDKHYKEYRDTTPQLKKLGRERWFAEILDPNFTLTEKIQRYICRVLWLYRNCGYGFAFYIFGRMVNPRKIITDKNYFDFYGHEVYAAHLAGENKLTRSWVYKNTMPIYKNIRWEIYCGWKISRTIDHNHPCQCMIAYRIAIRCK